MGPLIPLFWTSGDICPVFQSHGGFSHLRAYLPVHKGFLRFTSGVTPAFSTSMGVHCISMYMAWLARLLSHALGFEPPMQWWAAQRCMTKSDALSTELSRRPLINILAPWRGRCLESRCLRPELEYYQHHRNLLVTIVTGCPSKSSRI